MRCITCSRTVKNGCRFSLCDTNTQIITFIRWKIFDLQILTISVYCCTTTKYLASGDASDVHRRRGFSPGGLGPPVETRGEAQVGVWGPSSPEAEAVCWQCLHILTAETIKIWKLPYIKLLRFLTSPFHSGGNRHFAGLSTQAHAWRATELLYKKLSCRRCGCRSLQPKSIIWPNAVVTCEIKYINYFRIISK